MAIDLPVGVDSRTPPFPVKRARRRNRGIGEGTPLIYLLLGAVLLASVFPLYWSFIISTQDNSFLGSGTPPFLPGGNLVENLSRVFDRMDFWPALLNSVIVSTVTAVACTFLASLAGFAFARLPFRGRNVLFIAVVVTAMAPTQLGVVPLYMLMSNIGWVGTLNAIIFPALVSAFGVFWMRQAAEETVPYELIEAARVDGASTLRTFLVVGWPSVRSQAAVLFMFVFMGTWNDFFWPFIVLNDPSVQTLQTALASLRSGYAVDTTLFITGATLAVTPLIIVFVAFSRQIVGGLMQGALKG